MNFNKMRTTYSQFQTLVEYMEKHGDISKYKPNPVGKANMLNHWEELSLLANRDAAGGTGPVRTADQWRKVWSDFKNNSRKKAAKVRKSENSDKRRSLSKLESRVMGIINSNNVDQPKVHGSSEMVDVDGLALDIGGKRKPKHPVLDSDSENEEVEEDKVEVKIDYSIQNYNVNDYDDYPSAFHEPMKKALQRNEQKDNVTNSLIEIRNQINGNIALAHENKRNSSVVRSFEENNNQKKFNEEPQNAGDNIINNITNDWLQQNQQKCNILNSWINSIQYKRQKNTSASGWVESDVLRCNETVMKQMNNGSVLNNAQTNCDTNKPQSNVNKKGSDNSLLNHELNNNSIRTTVINIRTNSSSQDIKQLNYGVSNWKPIDVEKNFGEDNATQNKEQKGNGKGIVVESNRTNCLAPKGNYGLDISTRNRQLQDHASSAGSKGVSLMQIDAEKKFNTVTRIERISESNNNASSSTQCNERSTENIADEIDDPNSGGNNTINPAQRQKSEQAIQPELKRKRKIGEDSSLSIDDDREQRKHDRELELMRMEIQKEELKLKTRRLTLMERIVTMVQQFL